MVPAPCTTDRVARPAPPRASRSTTEAVNSSRNGAASPISAAESNSPLPCAAYQAVIRSSDHDEVGAVLMAGEPHRGWVAALSGTSALVLLGRRRSPLAACVTAFATLALSTSWNAHITTPQFFGVLVTFAVSGAVAARRDAVLAW